VRISFNCTSDTGRFWINGTQAYWNNGGTPDEIFQLYHDVDNLTVFYISTKTEIGNYNLYVDAIDYSWAPGYYLNRNEDDISINSTLSYAIFENQSQKIPWQPWATTVQVEYNVSGENLGVGTHNISLVFNDTNNQWSHSDVMITVLDVEPPNILNITQNPIYPDYQEPVQILAQITDNTQVQSVMIETNHTLNENISSAYDYLGNYSFTKDSAGSDPTGWVITEDSSTDVSVLSELDKHHQIVRLTDNNINGAATMYNEFDPQIKGTIELYMISSPAASEYAAYLGNLPLGSWEFYLSMGWNVADTWYHVRISFNCTSDTGRFWINGTQAYWNNGGTPDENFLFLHDVDNLTVFYLSTKKEFTNTTLFVDAIDYSWTPGYYLNRNKDYEAGKPIDYLGKYSFTNELIGSNPMGWMIEEGGSTEVQIQSDLDGHNKIVELTDDTSNASACIRNVFSSQTTGTIELWVRGSSSTKESSLYLGYLPEGNWNLYFMMGQDGNPYWYFWIGYNVPVVYSNLDQVPWDANKWYHVRIQFDCISDTGKLWIDGTEVYWNNSGLPDGDFPFYRPASYFNIFLIGTTDIHSSFDFYVDAIDYSWESGYYLNRNTKYQSQEYIFTNKSMTLLSGNLQNGLWNYTYNDYPINQRIAYRIFAKDIYGNVVVSEESTFGFFPTTNWELPTNLEVDVDLKRNRRGELSLTFKNSGTTTMLDLNFTIILPVNWSTDVDTLSFTQLNPGEAILLTFKITAPETFNGSSVELAFINFEANIYETGAKEDDTFLVVITGVEVGRWFIWLIIIVGSAAAAAATSFVFIHRRRGPSEGPKDKKKGKSSNKLKKALIADFPGLYSTLPIDLFQEIHEIQGISAEEKVLLKQDLTQFDEAEARQWLEEFKKSLKN